MDNTARSCMSIYHMEKLKKMRKLVYIIIILFGWIGIFFPYVAHADILGFEIEDVYAEITENVNETNAILKNAFTFCKTSPFTVVNSLSGDQANTLTVIIDASKDTALVVAVLLLMVDFFRKSVTFEWSSRWENVLLFLIKLLVIKQVVQNADTIIASIYGGFNYINDKAIGAMGGSIEFLPCKNIKDYTWQKPQSVSQHLHKGWWDFWEDLGAGDIYNTYTYPISEEAVKMFYPNASLPDPSSINLENTALPNPTSRMNFMPTLEMVKLQPFFLIMKAVAYLIFVIAAGRVFELAVMTIFAPLPLATFASETSSDVARNFIKNYIATVIQIAVIVAMFMVYVALNKAVVDAFSTTKLIQFVVLLTLGMGVMKSGAWAKKICGLG